MRKKMILRLSVLAVFLALLWSCRSEDFTKAETNPQRNNADFFKHKSSLSAKNTTDYIRILEVYSLETDFLSGMPDQKGMPIWDKMKVVETKEAIGLTIPLSYDNETMSSLLFVILDAKNTVNGIRNMTNDNLESLVYNPGYSIRSRESLMNTFIMMDHHTFGNEVFTNIPTDLFAGHKEGENNRLIYKGDHGDFTNTVEYNAEGKILVIYNTTCTTSWHCKNDKPIGYCDGCSKCKSTTCSTTITTIFTDGNDDFPTWDGGEGGGGGGTTAPPKDPCGLASVFYRPAPGCGGGGTIPNINDLCEKLKAQNSNPDFRVKVNVLETNLDEHGETGFVEKHNGSYDYKDNASSSDDSNSLTLGDPTSDMKGFLHTHVNDFEDSNGAMRIGFKIFSPADVIYFNQMVALAQQNGIPLSNIYAVLISGKGNYQIRFTGNANQIKTAYTNTKKEYNEMYINYFKQNKDRSDEMNFLKFIDEQMYVKGITLVKMNDDGTMTKKTLNSTRTQIIDADCF